MDSLVKLIPSMDDLTLWLFLNIVLFLFVGIFQLAYPSGPGSILSAGAILLALLYILLWMRSKSDRKMGHQAIMLVSGLAVLGDLIVMFAQYHGSFSGTSALLDFLGIMLFRSAYKELRAPS
jgi:hypothetical protein